MKKLLSIIIITLLIITSVKGQELTGFMGIPFGSTKSEIKTKFLAKNPNAKIYTDEVRTLTFTDFNFAGKKAMAVVFGLNEKSQMHTAVVLLETERDDDVFELYDNIVNEINDKYHYRDVDNEIWRYPFEKSDKYDYGVTAIKSGKCVLQSIWYFDVNDPESHDDDNAIAVQNTESCDIKITYQDGIMISNVVSNNKAKDSQDY